MRLRTRPLVTRAGLAALLIAAGVGQPIASAVDDSTVGTDGYIHVSPMGQVLGPDKYYPKDGNGGYDVASYDVTLDYDKTAIKATSKIKATTTQDLTRFNLDLRGLDVSSVTVDGQKATFAREGEHELVITPGEKLAKGAEITIEVAYSGKPQSIKTPRGVSGWRTLTDGSVVALGSPHGAQTWMPVNDTQVDKAIVSLTVTAPEGYTTIAGGTQSTGATRDGRVTTKWSDATPVAPGAIMLVMGSFELKKGTLDGKPVYTALGKGTNSALADKQAEVIKFLSTKITPYPMSSSGALMLSCDGGWCAEGYFNAPQTRSVLCGCAGESDLVHTTAAQWYGNEVSPKTWADASLIDSQAKYATWLWDEHKGVKLDERYKEIMAKVAGDEKFWARKLSDPGKGQEFAVADKGVLMTHALRMKVGDEKFFKLYHSFVQTNHMWNQGWYDWQLFAKAKTQTKLDPFFKAWVDGTTVPPAGLR